jgi:glycosyltransferase involved in cell wall biosynthesis
MSTRPDGVAFMFHYGHGHATQLENFRECVPPEYADRTAWISLRGDSSGSRLARLPFVPPRKRYGLHYAWNGYNGLRQRNGWKALFIAGAPPSFIPLLLRHRTFVYNDLTPSLCASLAPWYPKPGSLTSWRGRLRNRMYHLAEGVFTMSRWAADGHIKDFGLAPERVRVSLPGANLKRWSFVDRRGRSDNRPIRILMVGGQFRLKGGELILRWAEETRLRNWELDIVTWPSELPEWVLESLAHPEPYSRASASLSPRLPNVRVHCGMFANTPELMALFEEADIFCLPTQADGSSIASLEAMACGLPVLVGGVGGIPELIEDGKTGFLMKRSDQMDMNAKLERLICDRDLRLQIGESARQSCEDYYNVPRQLREIMDVIDADSRPPGATWTEDESRARR